MKKLIFILLFFSATKTIKAQVPDTLAYLQSIVATKAQYIGQPFSVLMNNLQIQIKFYFPFASMHADKTKETSTSFAFYFPPTAEEIDLTYPHLEIYWLPSLNADQSRALRSQYRSVGWNQQIATHYSMGIIADIKLRE